MQKLWHFEFEVLRTLWHFEILTREPMGKPKMWNISKTGHHRAKRTNIWDSGYYSAHMEGTFDARFIEFGLGHSMHFPILQFLKLLLSQFSSDFFQSSYKVS